MKSINLLNKNGKIIGKSIIDDDDFIKISKHRWYLTSAGYVARSVTVNKKKKALLLHREIMNPEKSLVVDHLNGNTTDNRKKNLRICTHAENIRHRTKINKNNISGIIGVSKFRNKFWRSRIMFMKKEISLGIYIDIKDAIKAREDGEKKYFGKYKSLNGI